MSNFYDLLRKSEQWNKYTFHKIWKFRWDFTKVLTPLCPFLRRKATTEKKEKKKEKRPFALLGQLTNALVLLPAALRNQAPENALNMQSVLIHHKNVSPTYHAIALPRRRHIMHLLGKCTNYQYLGFPKAELACMHAYFPILYVTG